MTDKFNFKCTNCGHPVEADLNNLPADDEEFRCSNCNHSFGTYGEFKKHSLELAKAEVDKMTKKHFGKKPVWGKK